MARSRVLQLARGNAPAPRNARPISDARVAISIWADKRFDDVRSELGGRLEIAAVAQRSMQEAMLRVQDSPNLLKPMNRLADLLIDSLQFQQALQVTDSAIERQDTQGRGAWSDYDLQYAWTLENRAQALSELGREEAALTQFEAASRAESSADKVSHIIDLAIAYNEAGRPREAMKTLQRMSPAQASRFGVMVSGWNNSGLTCSCTTSQGRSRPRLPAQAPGRRSRRLPGGPAARRPPRQGRSTFDFATCGREAAQRGARGRAVLHRWCRTGPGTRTAPTMAVAY